MPFEPQASEAHALRGALSFLFTLISFYSEMLEQEAFATGDLEHKGAGLH